MSIDFVPVALEPASGSWRPVPLPAELGERRVNLSNANAAEACAEIGCALADGALLVPVAVVLERARDWRERHRDRSRGGHDGWTDAASGRLTLVQPSRRDGYLSSTIDRLIALAEAGASSGATHIAAG